MTANEAEISRSLAPKLSSVLMSYSLTFDNKRRKQGLSCMCYLLRQVKVKRSRFIAKYKLMHKMKERKKQQLRVKHLS